MIPESLKTTIEDWFGPREVVDEQMFNLYFNRVLNRDFPAYNELLAVQPGYAQIDWTVVNYSETENKHEGTNVTSGLTHSAGSTANESTKSGSVINHATGGTGQTVNTKGSSDHNGSSINDTNATANGKNAKNVSVSGSENGNEQYIADDKKNFDKTEYHKANANIDFHDPSKLKETDEAINRQGYRDSVQTIKRQGSVSNHKVVNKNLPMTISFSKAGGDITGATANIMETDKPATNGADGGKDIPDATWEGATDMHQDVDRTVPIGNHPDQQITKRVYDDIASGKKGNTTTKSYEGNSVDKHGSVDGKYISENGTLQDLNGGSYDQTSHKAETAKDVSRSHADITAENGNEHKEDKQNAKESESSVDNSAQHQESVGSSVNDSEQSYKDLKDAQKGNNSQDITTSGTANSNATDHVITTGRQGGKTLAEIFDEATRFIESTSAWIWLEGRLEICFMQVL